MDPTSSILPRNYPLSIIFLPYSTFSFQTSLSRSNLQKKHRKTFLQPCFSVQFPFSSIPLFPSSLPSFLFPPLNTQTTWLPGSSLLHPLGSSQTSGTWLLLLSLHKNAAIKVIDAFLVAQPKRYFSVLNLPCSSVMWHHRPPLLNVFISLGFHDIDFLWFSVFSPLASFSVFVMGFFSSSLPFECKCSCLSRSQLLAELTHL